MRAIRGACEGAFATEGDARPERERGMLVRDASPLPPKSRAGRNARNGYISEGERPRRTVKRPFESAHRTRIEKRQLFRFFLDSFPGAFSPRKSRTVVHTRHRRASITGCGPESRLLVKPRRPHVLPRWKNNAPLRLARQISPHARAASQAPRAVTHGRSREAR